MTATLPAATVLAPAPAGSEMSFSAVVSAVSSNVATPVAATSAAAAPPLTVTATLPATHAPSGTVYTTPPRLTALAASPGSEILVLSPASNDSETSSPVCVSAERIVDITGSNVTYRNTVTGSLRIAALQRTLSSFEIKELDSIAAGAKRIVGVEVECAQDTEGTDSGLFTFISNLLNSMSDGAVLVIPPDLFSLLKLSPESQIGASLAVARERFGHTAPLNTLVAVVATHTASAHYTEVYGDGRDIPTNHFTVVLLEAGEDGRVAAIRVFDHYSLSKKSYPNLSTAERYPAQPTKRDQGLLHALVSIVERSEHAVPRVAPAPIVYHPSGLNVQTPMMCAYLAVARAITLAEPPSLHPRLSELVKAVADPIESEAAARDLMSNIAKTAAMEILQRIEAEKTKLAVAAPPPSATATGVPLAAGSLGGSRGGRARVGPDRGPPAGPSGRMPAALSRGRTAAAPSPAPRAVTRSHSRSSAQSL